MYRKEAKKLDEQLGLSKKSVTFAVSKTGY